MARKPISKGKRFEIFKRDGFICQYCGSHPPGVILHVDHIVAVANGGGNEDTNLITSCSSCNLEKSASDLSAIPKSLAERAAETAEREMQIAGYSQVMMAERQRIEDDAWTVAERLTPGAEAGYPLKDLASIKRFVKLIGLPEAMEAADIARARHGDGYNAFKYFCGVCWRKAKAGTENG